MKNNKTVLVTGGAGAIGSNLVKTLLKDDIKVILLDDFSSGMPANLKDISSDKVKIVNGNICDQKTIDEAFAYGIDYVYHLAANFANQNSVNNPQKDLKTNGLGILKILQACVDNKVKKFLLSSSSCIYKPGKGRFIEHGPTQFQTPYAITKMLQEYYTIFFNKFHKLPVVIVRYFNSYGPGTYPGKFRGVVPKFMYQAINNQALEITGDGSETRPFTYVQDIVDGTICAMDNSKNTIGTNYPGHPINEDNLIYNIGNSDSITIKEFAETVNKICGNKSGIKFTPRRDWDNIPYRAVNNTKAEHELNFKPKYNLEEGLRLTYKWFKEQNFTEKDLQ